MKKAFWLAITLVLFCFSDNAQTSQTLDDVDNQSWNDLQVTVGMNKFVDFFMKETLRFGKNVSRLNEQRFAVGFVFKPDKNWAFSPFYWSINARNTRGIFFQEHRLNMQAVYKLPFKKIALSHRSLFEYRMRQPANTWRYRPSLTFEQDIKKLIPDTKFFVTEEVFYDSGTERFSRNRFSIGITKTITKKLAVDIYYMRQNDGFTHPGDLNVIWTSTKIRL